MARMIQATTPAARSTLRHPVHARFLVPLRRHLLRLRPELDRAAAGDVADAELRFVPAAEAERLARHRAAPVPAGHARRDVVDQRRADVVAVFFSRNGVAAPVDENLRPLLLGLGDVALDALLRLARD